MKSRRSEAEAGRGKVGTLGGTIRPLIATIKQTLGTMPGINRLVPGGRKPVTHLYPYQKVDLPLAYRGQHSIDWFKCIGCELCAKVCPNECIYFEFYEVEPTSEFLHPSRVQLHAGVRARGLRPGGPLLPRGRTPHAEGELGQGDRPDQSNR